MDTVLTTRHSGINHYSTNVKPNLVKAKKQMMCVIAILGQSLQLFFNQVLVVRVTLAHEPNFTVCIPVWHHHNKNGGKVYSLWTHTSVSKHHHSSAPLSWGPNDTKGPPTLPIFHALVLFLLLGWISPGCHVWTGSIASSALGWCIHHEFDPANEKEKSRKREGMWKYVNIWLFN